MTLKFNLMATIEVPNADIFSPRESLEEEIVKMLRDEGMIPHGLEVTNYCAVEEDE